MEEEAPQFDVLLGGTEELPPSANVARFTACRNQEIQFMANALLSQSGAKLAFQTLPKHLRRRAMSHNVKRLPRRLRQIHLNQMKKSGMPAKQKRPSRKYRRRPRNLLEEYTRRSNGKYKWLQTHIWHAKRFHMVQKWGYKLPCHPCDKAFRACYRATTQHCLLQDISYYNCIEIAGNRNIIVEKLKELSRPNVGLSVGAKAFIRGTREGELTLFEIQPPHKAIGTINFHWQPGTEDGASKLWMWIHAAFYYNVLNTLIQSFQVKSCDNDTNNFSYTNETTGIKLVELARELSRFRLSGPLANAILQDAFIVLDGSNTDLLSQKWLQEYTESEDNKQLIENQCIYWKSIVSASSVSEIAPHIILSLIVKDPRLNLPKKRYKCVPSHAEKSVEYNVPENISSNPLWDEKLRERIFTSRPDAQKIGIKNNLLLPGSEATENIFSPVILIQRPGNKTGNIGLGSGWDIIVPAVWAKPFWIALIMRGARVGGLRESKSMLFEMGKSQFLHPDTEAGMEEERQISEECVEKFFRKPPNKRINYNKFNIVSPFHWNWKLLLKDWQNSTPVEDFVVLKDIKTLNAINLMLTSKSNVIPECPGNCLIPVQLECEKRGAPVQFAIICLPKCKNDVEQAVIEPVSEDKYQIARKELRQAHQIILKKMRKQRKSAKLKPTDANELATIAIVHKDLLINYTKKMRELWLPEATSIRNSCSREIIGFVSKGGFSFSHGKSFATGYIVANALAVLVNSDIRNKVLFRNTNTRQYRVAKLSVIVD